MAAADPPADPGNPDHPSFPHPIKDGVLPPPTSTGVGPTVSVWPNHGVRFAPGQRFDIRVEGTGLAPTYNFAASLKINGQALAFTSGNADPNTTDGISNPGWGGFNVRGYSLDRPGIYTLEATFSSSQGTKTVTQSLTIEKLNTGSSKVKNIIFLLGDGMSISHRTAARVVRYGLERGTPKGWLAMDKFPTHGIVTTSSLNSYVTDSSPGFSAYTTGSHHNNNQEGVFPAQVVSPFFQPRVEYITEYLHRTQGKVTGIVTTSDVEDATPGSMAAHTGNRGAGTGITDQFFDESDVAGTGAFGTGLKVLMGGGRQWFIPAGSPGSGRSSSGDYPALPADVVAGWNLPAASAGALDPARDLLADFTAAGFAYAPDWNTLNGLVNGGGPIPGKVLGLFRNGHMNVAVDKIAHRRGVLIDNASTFAVVNDGYPNQPMLDEMAAAALKVLSQYPNGFVALIEGASIDKQAHAQDADRSIGDTIEFDRAVAVAKAFAEQDKNTLVLVLTDHECAGFAAMGGLRVPGVGNAGSLAYLNGLPSDAAVTAPGSTPARQSMVGTYEFAGNPVYTILGDGYPQNYNIDGKVLVGFGGGGNRYETWLTRPLPGGNGLGSFESARGFFIRGQSAGNSSAVHTASDVPVSAYAANATIHRLFNGTYENIDVFFRTMAAAGAH